MDIFGGLLFCLPLKSREINSPKKDIVLLKWTVTALQPYTGVTLKDNSGKKNLSNGQKFEQ